MAQDPSTAVEIAQLQLTTQHLATLVEKIHDGMEGTNKTQGLKEKLTIARYDIDLNKQAYQAVMDELKNTETRIGKSLMELSNSMTITINSKMETINKRLDATQADNEKQNAIFQKIQPWINGISWFVTVAGGIIMSLILTGKLNIAFK